MIYDILNMNNKINVSTQTETDYLLNNNVNTQTEKKRFFKHLEFANQTYFEHFYDSIGYCGKCLKSSFYFFVHAIWPDIFQQNGSNTVRDLNNVITSKYERRMRELSSLQNQ
jgi:hypothetical protein